MFGWSFSKGELFRACPRAFFFAYASKEEPYADEAAKLKKMTNPTMMAGTIIDSVIGRTLKRMGEDDQVDRSIASEGVRIFDKWCRDSITFGNALRLGESVPDRAVILLKNYFGEEYSEASIDSARLVVHNTLSNFQNSEIATVIESSDRTSWGKVRIYGDGLFPPSFTLRSGLLVWAAYDFFFVLGNKLQILDWKSGKKSEVSIAKANKQLAIYALYGQQVLGFTSENTFVQPVWLQYELEWSPQAINDDLIAESQDCLETEASTVLERLSPEGAWRPRNGRSEKTIYAASSNDFPAVPEQRSCLACNFLSICLEGQLIATTITDPPGDDGDPESAIDP